VTSSFISGYSGATVEFESQKHDKHLRDGTWTVIRYDRSLPAVREALPRGCPLSFLDDSLANGRLPGSPSKVPPLPEL